MHTKTTHELTIGSERDASELAVKFSHPGGAPHGGQLLFSGRLDVARADARAESPDEALDQLFASLRSFLQRCLRGG